MIDRKVLPTVYFDAQYLAPRMRQADVDEVYAMSGVSPLEALEQSVAASPDPRTGFMEGQIACMFGVAEHPMTALNSVGIPWLLTSDLISDHSLAFLRGSCDYIQEMRERYALLCNFVDARNTVSIEWLKWLGFEIQEPICVGYLGMPFHPFKMRGLSYVAQ